MVYPLTPSERGIEGPPRRHLHNTTGGTLYGVQKTTVYLPDDLKAAVAREADQRGVPEAEVIRDAIAAAVRRPSPRPGVFESERPIAARADELLAGFGDR